MPEQEIRTSRFDAVQRLTLCASLVVLSFLSLTAQDDRQPDFRSVAAANLKKLSVDFQSSASSRGLERVPYEVRSPDRRRVARVQKLSALRESQRFRILISGPGRRRTVIADDVTNYFGLTWSPDGSKVAFSEGALVHIVDSDGRTRQVIHQGPGGPYPGACFDLAWSNAGRTLSFTQVENAQQLDLSRPLRVVITLDGALRP